MKLELIRIYNKLDIIYSLYMKIRVYLIVSGVLNKNI